jgi:cytoskeleton protein RodZ
VIVLRPVPKEPRDLVADVAPAEVPHAPAPPSLERSARSGAPAAGSGGFEPVLPPQTVGAILTVTRLKFGQDLRQVSQALRIRQLYLEAIEQDRHSDLPGLAYAVGFVRSYADYLGLDGKALVQRYKDEAQGVTRKPTLVFPSPMQEAKVPTGALILVSLILVGLAYAGWTYFSRETAPPPATVSAPPSTGTASTPAPAPAPSAGDANASEAPQPAAAPAPAPSGIAVEAPLAGTSGGANPTPAPGGSLGGPLTAPMPAAGAAQPAPAPSVAASAVAAGEGTAAEAIPAAPPAPAGDAAAPATTQAAALPTEPAARVVIRAKQDSWVQIRDAKDQAILTRVLREGESYEVPNQAGLILLTGNAGGLVISVDGKALPPLGAVGAVKRNVALDPDKLAPAN